MSKPIKIWIYKDEVAAQILKAPEMQQLLAEEAGKIAQRAGDGYEAETKVAASRAYARVYAKTYKAKRDNAKNNTLLRSIK